MFPGLFVSVSTCLLVFDRGLTSFLQSLVLTLFFGRLLISDLLEESVFIFPSLTANSPILFVVMMLYIHPSQYVSFQLCLDN